jgi:hypothetical protein
MQEASCFSIREAPVSGAGASRNVPQGGAAISKGAGTLMPDTGPARQAVLLFKITSVRDEIVIGIAPEELLALGGSDAGAIGRALSRGGELTAWQFVVRRRQDGTLEQAPLRRISILRHESVRVEPYTTPLPIAPIREDVSNS